MATPETSKTLAKIEAAAFGGTPRVTRFWDDDKVVCIDVLSAKDRPQQGVTAYGTLGLCETPLYLDGEEYPVRLEIVGACSTERNSFPNALATAAFCIMKSKWFCAPGVIFPDAISLNDNSLNMKHLLFVPPFLWEKELITRSINAKTITWLLAIPISDSEKEFAIHKSPAALEDIFVNHQIDVFDLDRQPVV